MRFHSRRAVVVCLFAGAASSSFGQLSFTNETDALGLAFTHTRGPLYGFLGAGGVAADFNNDGYVDLYVLGGGDRPDALFINRGPDAEGNFSFVDEAPAWDVDFAHYSFGASAADYNRDGFIDLYVTSYGTPSTGVTPGMHKLLTNLGPGAGGQWSFVDEAELCGVNELTGTDLTDGTGSTWGDYDLDGDLDLMVGWYRTGAHGNRLFRNDGFGPGHWLFTDVTEAAGFANRDIRTYVPAFLDMNADRYPELLLVADTGTSTYLVNNADGTFTDRTDWCDDLHRANGMGAAVGDVNQDGLLDMYVSSAHYDFLPSSGNLLLIQQPNRHFENLAQEVGVSDGGWGWGVLIVDLDNDGLNDLVETNGFSTGYGNEQSYMYLNHGGMVFTEEAIARGFVHNGQGRGLIDFDFDNDGDRDLVIFASGEPMSVFENHLLEPGQPVPADAHWIDLTFDTYARDTLAPAGLNTHITLYAGATQQVLYADAGFSHCSQSEIVCHAGLGSANTIDRIRIQWQDGSFTTLTNVPADQKLNVRAAYHPADLNGSDTVDIFDALEFVGWYSDGDLQADHNGDGLLSVYDMIGFLNDFADAQ